MPCLTFFFLLDSRRFASNRPNSARIGPYRPYQVVSASDRNRPLEEAKSIVGGKGSGHRYNPTIAIFFVFVFLLRKVTVQKLQRENGGGVSNCIFVEKTYKFLSDF